MRHVSSNSSICSTSSTCTIVRKVVSFLSVLLFVPVLHVLVVVPVLYFLEVSPVPCCISFTRFVSATFFKRSHSSPYSLCLISTTSSIFCAIIISSMRFSCTSISAILPVPFVLQILFVLVLFEYSNCSMISSTSIISILLILLVLFFLYVQFCRFVKRVLLGLPVL